MPSDKAMTFPVELESPDPSAYHEDGDTGGDDEDRQKLPPRNLTSHRDGADEDPQGGRILHANGNGRARE